MSEVSYFIVIEEVCRREELTIRHSQPNQKPRKKLQVGEIGAKPVQGEDKDPTLVSLSMLDDTRADVAVRCPSKLRALTEETAGLLLSVSDVATRWKVYSSEELMAAARALRLASAVVYRNSKVTYSRSFLEVGMVVNVGSVAGQLGTYFSVELLGRKAKIVNNEDTRVRLRSRHPTEPIRSA